MSIAQYLKVIGRGSRGARALDRAQATDMLGRILDGTVSDLEIGAFCVAMRIKGESAEEVAGFLEAIRARSRLVPEGGTPPVVLPSYNGARRLPVLTPLLALLLARRGLPVLVHGTATEDARVGAREVFRHLGVHPSDAVAPVAAGSVVWLDTQRLDPGLKRLLDVRRAIGLRNPAHSLVKLMNPCAGRALVVGSHTHPEYAVSMAETFALTGADAMLLRGSEGEPIADPRRRPVMTGFVGGARLTLEVGESIETVDPSALPALDPGATAAWIRAVLAGTHPVPVPIALQVEHLVALHRRMTASPVPFTPGLHR